MKDILEQSGRRRADNRPPRRLPRRRRLLGSLPLLFGLCLGLYPSASQEAERFPFLVVLGTAQDGGIPQAGTKPEQLVEGREGRRVVSLGLVDPLTGQRWMFEATPDFREQLLMLDQIAPNEGVPGLEGILLSHAHMGHYTGLVHLGYEAMGSANVPVWAPPRMVAFLRANGPWDQLVRYRNIDLRVIPPNQTIQLNGRLAVEAFEVPHREEYSETFGFRILGPSRSVLFIPDIDNWGEWDEEGRRIEDLLAQVDLAYLDGTFYQDGEIRGRDMSGFPHPRILDSMIRFESLPLAERSKVHFIHLNHTNPAVDASSPASEGIARRGFRVAKEGEIEPL